MNENSTDTSQASEPSIDEKMDQIFNRVYDLISYAAYIMAKEIIEAEVNTLVEKELAKRMLNEEMEEINNPIKNTQKLAQ